MESQGIAPDAVIVVPAVQQRELQGLPTERLPDSQSPEQIVAVGDEDSSQKQPQRPRRPRQGGQRPVGRRGPGGRRSEWLDTLDNEIVQLLRQPRGLQLRQDGFAPVAAVIECLTTALRRRNPVAMKDILTVVSTSYKGDKPRLEVYQCGGPSGTSFIRATHGHRCEIDQALLAQSPEQCFMHEPGAASIFGPAAPAIPMPPPPPPPPSGPRLQPQPAQSPLLPPQPPVQATPAFHASPAPSQAPQGAQVARHALQATLIGEESPQQQALQDSQQELWKLVMDLRAEVVQLKGRVAYLESELKQAFGRSTTEGYDDEEEEEGEEERGEADSRSDSAHCDEEAHVAETPQSQEDIAPAETQEEPPAADAELQLWSGVCIQAFNDKNAEWETGCLAVCPEETLKLYLDEQQPGWWFALAASCTEPKSGWIPSWCVEATAPQGEGKY